MAVEELLKFVGVKNPPKLWYLVVVPLAARPADQPETRVTMVLTGRRADKSKPRVHWTNLEST